MATWFDENRPQTPSAVRHRGPVQQPGSGGSFSPSFGAPATGGVPRAPVVSNLGSIRQGQQVPAGAAGPTPMPGIITDADFEAQYGFSPSGPRQAVNLEPATGMAPPSTYVDANGNIRFSPNPDAQRRMPLGNERVNVPGTQVPGSSGPIIPQQGGGDTSSLQAQIQARMQELAQQGIVGAQATQMIGQEFADQGVTIPTRAGGTLPSEDKIVMPGGQVFDLYGDVGGANNLQWHPDGYWVDGQSSSTPGVVTPMGGDGAMAGGTLGNLNGMIPQGPNPIVPFDRVIQTPTGTDDPGFQFAMEQGQQALERSAAARGTLLTGGTLKDLASFSIGTGLQGYDQAWNRAFQQQNAQFGQLYNTAGLGLNAATSYGNQATDLITGAGNAQAAGTATSHGAYADLAANLGNLGANTVVTRDYFRRQNHPGRRFDPSHMQGGAL